MKDVIGIPWFDDTTFSMAQEAFGFDFIPDTYDEQLEHQQAMENKYLSKGHSTHRVPVDPIPVAEWMIQQERGDPSPKLLFDFAQDYLITENCAPDPHYLLRRRRKPSIKQRGDE